MSRLVLAGVVGLLVAACGSPPEDLTSTTTVVVVPKAEAAAVSPSPVEEVSAADRYGLSDSVSVAVRAPELDLVLDLSVSPAASSADSLSLFGRFASCSAIEGPSWLPFEVVVAEGVGQAAVRIAGTEVDPRSKSSQEVRIRIDDGSGGVIDAVGGVAASSDGTSGTWSGTTIDGNVVSGSYSCEGTPRGGNEDYLAEVSVRLIDESTGVIRTLGARSGASSWCPSVGSAGEALRIEEAEEPAGGLVAATVETVDDLADGATGIGSVTLTVPGGGIRFSTVEVMRLGSGGVITGTDGGARRIDAAWTCR